MPFEIIRQPREERIVTMGQADRVVTPPEPEQDEWYLPPGATEPIRRKPSPKPAPVEEPSEPEPAVGPEPAPAEPQTTETTEATESEPQPVQAAPRRGRRPRKE